MKPLQRYFNRPKLKAELRSDGHGSPESTLSLDPEIRRTVDLYSRTYQEHSIDRSIYCVPVDEVQKLSPQENLDVSLQLIEVQTEYERLVLQHRILQRLFKERLIFPPIRNPERILDCGCGPAAWATDVAEMYPESKVGEPQSRDFFLQVLTH